MAGARETFGLEVEVDDAAARAALARLVARIRRPAPALREVGEVLTASTKRRFGSQTDPEGRRWTENSEVTIARKNNPNVLTDEGDLGGTIRYQLADADLSVLVGSDRVYAAMQQFGGTTTQWPHLWGDIPARPFLGLSEADRTEVLEVFTDYLAP